MNFSPKIGVLGLGYVGLPVALACARKFESTIGFDIDQRKVNMIHEGKDPTFEGFDDEVKQSSLRATVDEEDLKGCNFFIVTVPTPVDEYHCPDLRLVRSASEILGRVVSKGSIIVFESTVYPGITEDFCAPIIEEVSGLKSGVDFKLGYSPERINPGDKVHTLEKIVKVVSAQDAESLEVVSNVYSSFVEVGVHEAPSIKVAEAAKVIENTQRDLNIALMNELAVIFEKIGVRTNDVLTAAGTKWNFLKFSPGLVGGHCIGVDPYYLTSLAEKVGYYPEVILSGRRINDGMGRFIVSKTVKMMVAAGKPIKDARVGVVGLTFKENIADIRNSRVPDIVRELDEYGIKALVTDPHADEELANKEYSIALSNASELSELDACILAVPHDAVMSEGVSALCDRVVSGGVLIDVKSALKPGDIRSDLSYWSL